ncbi:hypothetical protein GCM10027615_01040 [Plantactinospora veratri]
MRRISIRVPSVQHQVLRLTDVAGVRGELHGQRPEVRVVDLVELVAAAGVRFGPVGGANPEVGSPSFPITST